MIDVFTIQKGFTVSFSQTLQTAPFRSLMALACSAVLGLTACSLVPEQAARWEMEELEVSRSCNLTDVALDFSQGGKRDLGSAFYQMTLSPDRSAAQVLNTATGCLDTIRSDTGPMEIDDDLRGLRLSEGGEVTGAEAFDAVFAACEARRDLGELRAYEVLSDEAAARFVKANPGVLLEAAGPCDFYLNDMQLWMRLRTASHTYLYASIGETLIVEEILPE
ncbi:hypothetical protein [Tritonibacter multivorans]|uniref:hypothetical protein n=1 Tax=Tritonibacter multivorans TaxID=928856 RepID=UPI00071CBE56|nr:hypothetical protein [Tritonibacter multivorans]